MAKKIRNLKELCKVINYVISEVTYRHFYGQLKE